MTFHTRAERGLHLVVYDSGIVAAACETPEQAEILAHAGKHLPLMFAALVKSEKALRYFATGAANNHITAETARTALDAIHALGIT